MGSQEVGEGPRLLKRVVGLSRALDDLLAWGRLPDTRAYVPSYSAQRKGEGRTILATFKSPCPQILLNFPKARFDESLRQDDVEVQSGGMCFQAAELGCQDSLL